MKCNQCQALMINGVFCHETGCPNSRKTWDEERQEWIRYVECRECGAEYGENDTHECDPVEFDDENDRFVPYDDEDEEEDEEEGDDQ